LIGCEGGDDTVAGGGRDIPAPCLAAPGGCTAKDGVFPLRGYDPDLPTDDLEPLAAALGAADVVGLGESAHASAGFIGLKVRLSRYLIERSGFRAVTWESSRVPARQLNAYLQSCEGDPTAAVKSLYPIWADVQTRGFARWLCEWNQRHPDARVQAHGFDVQDPSSDEAELQQFLSEAAPQQAAGLLGPIATCDRFALEECRAAIAAVKAYFEQHADELASRTSSEKLATASLALTSYEAWQEQTLTPDAARGFEARDLGMAEVFLRLRELYFPGQKALIWAHNIHVVKAHEAVATSWVGGPIVTQGTALARELGSSYRSVAVIGFDVSLSRPEQRGHVEPRPGPGSVEAILHGLAESALFVDLHRGEVAGLWSPEATLELGAPGVERHRPAENYDALLYLEQSPMADRL
jgi:erythromycin esterase-like protein